MTLEVAVRDLAASRRRSTSAPAARDIRGRHKSNAGQKTRRGGRGPFGGGGTLGGGGSGGGGGGGGGGKGHDGVPRAGKGLEAFLTLDHSVQVRSTCDVHGPRVAGVLPKCLLAFLCVELRSHSRSERVGGGRVSMPSNSGE